MEIKLDTSVDALYIKIKKGKVHRTIAKDAFLIDIDKKGKLLGIEVLNYSKAVPRKLERSSVILGESRKRFAIPASR